MNRAIHTFHDGVTATGNGTEYSVKNYDALMTFWITGDAATRTVNFEAKSSDGDWYALSGVNLGTLALASSTTGTSNEVWQVELTGWNAFRTRISAIALAGNLTIKGRVTG
jgi:hypothetical protein